MELDPIESTLQLSALKQFPQDQKELPSPPISEGNKSCLSPQNHKRTQRTIGKRGTRDTEFFHPSSLAYSKRDQLICKILFMIFIIKY
jgi:hypothetical protein